MGHYTEYGECCRFCNKPLMHVEHEYYDCPSLSAIGRYMAKQRHDNPPPPPEPPSERNADGSLNFAWLEWQSYDRPNSKGEQNE